MIPTIEQRVNLGIQLLDREVPGWQDHLDLAILDISSTSSCPISQLYNGYEEGARELGIWDNLEAQIEFGFDGNSKLEIYETECQQLTDEWKRQLGVG